MPRGVVSDCATGQEKHPPGQTPRLRDVDATISYRADIEVGNALAIPIVVSQTDLSR
jgi:hypothetical protein